MTRDDIQIERFNDLMSRASRVPGVADQIRNMLGCQFGRTITVPGDNTVCDQAAVQIIVGHYQGQAIDYKLCAHHAAIIIANTTPHMTNVGSDQ